LLQIKSINVYDLNSTSTTYLVESEQYWESFPVLEKMMRPIWASDSIDNSRVFFNNPVLLFENVTCLVVLFSIFLISILARPISEQNSSFLELYFPLIYFTTCHTPIFDLRCLVFIPIFHFCLINFNFY